jgi:hypothetical protein
MCRTSTAQRGSDLSVQAASAAAVRERADLRTLLVELGVYA